MDENNPIKVKLGMKDGNVVEVTDVGLYYGCLSELNRGTKTVKEVRDGITKFENLEAYELCDAIKKAIKDFRAGGKNKNITDKAN